MRAIDYALRQGWQSLWRSRGTSLFAIVAIALAIVVLGTLLLVTNNINRVLARWAEAEEFSVYLHDDATSEQRGAIEALIDRSGITAGREYVSKADAMQRFRREFAELASLTADFDDNPFPASVEVRVRPGQASAQVEELVRQLATEPGVADVRYDRDWLARIGAGVRSVQFAGLGLALLMAIAAAVTAATVVRLGLQARRDELEIMELVGAPIAFIRGPFIAEGLLQGGIGALVALAGLIGGYWLVIARWGGELSAVLDGSAVNFLPWTLSAYLVGGGMAVGGVGGFVASRHVG